MDLSLIRTPASYYLAPLARHGSFIRSYVPFSEVFPGLPSDFASFRACVKQLSRTDTLFWCARLNLILSNPTSPNHKLTQEYAVRTFFTANEIARINTFARAHSPFGVFFRGQLFELMRWVCLWCEDHPDDGITFERPKICRTFVQAALMASDLWGDRVYGDRLSLDEGRDRARERALGVFRTAIADTSSGIDPLLALGRGHDIFSKRLSCFYPNFAQEFYARTQLTLDEFHNCLAAFMTSFLNRTPENVVENPGLFNVNTVCASAPHVQPLIAKYLALESQTAAELREALWGQRQDVTCPEEAGRYDYKALRRRPILRVSDGRAIIIDPVFYAERASVGQLFLITEGVSKAKSDQIFSAFGHAFETYVWGFLRRMYPTPGPELVDRLCCDVQGKDRTGQSVQITDACLNDVTEAILFEMKAVWVRDDVVLDDPARYLDHLRDKYGVRVEEDGNRSIKGVGQLARTITKLASGEWTPLAQDFTMVERLYPVLLVHDPLLDAPGHGHILAKEFAAALAPDEVRRTGAMRKGRFWVVPLIIMTVEDLECLETSIEYFSLHDLVRDYSADCSDRMSSLHNYMATSMYRTKLYRSRMMASSTWPSENEAVTSGKVVSDNERCCHPSGKTELPVPRGIMDGLESTATERRAGSRAHSVLRKRSAACSCASR